MSQNSKFSRSWVVIVNFGNFLRNLGVFIVLVWNFGSTGKGEELNMKTYVELFNYASKMPLQGGRAIFAIAFIGIYKLIFLLSTSSEIQPLSAFL